MADLVEKLNNFAIKYWRLIVGIGLLYLAYTAIITDSEAVNLVMFGVTGLALILWHISITSQSSKNQ